MLTKDEMPMFGNLETLRHLLDGTKVYKVYNLDDYKLNLVIDNGYDTVIIFTYTDVHLPEFVKKIKARNYKDLLKAIQEKYPEMKQWREGYPCMDDGDIGMVITKKGEYIYSRDIEWCMDDEFRRYYLINGSRTIYSDDVYVIQEMVPHDAEAIKLGSLRRRFKFHHREEI